MDTFAFEVPSNYFEVPSQATGLPRREWARAETTRVHGKKAHALHAKILEVQPEP